MKLTINNASIQNFKGIQNLTLDFNSKNAIISGDNETGKTTIYDTYTYLLTGKDSLGNSNSDLLKPTDKPIGVSPTANYSFQIDETRLDIIRSYKAKTNRAKEFTGKYETECIINGIPKNVSDVQEYFERLVMQASNIIDIPSEEIFKIVTDPLYLIEKMTAGKGETISDRQKQILRSICKIPTDLEYINQNSDYDLIIEDIKQHYAVENLIKALKAEMSSLNKIIDEHQTRIDQQAKNFVKIDFSIEDFEREKQEYNEKLENFKTQVLKNEQEYKNAINEIKDKISQNTIKSMELENKNDLHYVKSKSNYDLEIANKTKELNQKISEIEKEYNQKLFEFEKQSTEYNQKINSVSNQLQNFSVLSKEYENEIEKINNEKFDENTQCPLCNAKYEESKINSIKEKWETERVKKLMEVNAKLSNVNDNIKLAENELQGITKDLAELITPTLPKEYKTLTEEREGILKNVKPFVQTDMENYLELSKAIFDENIALTEKKEKLTKCYENEQCGKTDNEIKLNSIYSSINEKAKIIQKNNDCQKLIDELQSEHRQRLATKDKLQQKLDIAFDFYIYRCNKMSELIDLNFGNVKWQFVRYTKENNEPVPCCIANYNGRPYDNLSKSTKLICGLEIMQGFQRFTNCYFPIFIDDSEGIFTNINLDCQTIKLVAQEELCPKCNEKSNRRNQNGLWECSICRHHWEKTLKIKIQ